MACLAFVKHVLFAGTITHLCCEYLSTPIGVDNTSPRLTWRLPAGIARQEFYQVIVGTDSVKVASGEGLCWNSGKVRSSDILVSYAGNALQPCTRYYWKVQAWDGTGSMYTSDVTFFETGLMEEHNWKGNWITDTHDIHRKPAAYFRKVFNVGRAVKEARAYIAVAGLYELYVNGMRVGDHRLDPAFTRYDRRTLYLTHDITETLKSGENAVGVLLGNGWYNHQSTAVWNFDQAPWRGRPKFCMDIRIVYKDGTVEFVSTNSDWKTNLSPIVFNSIYTAEHYDARLEQPGWNTIGFDDSQWKKVLCTSAPSRRIVAQQMQPIRDVDTIRPVKIARLSDSCYVFDLGRNIAGVSELTVRGKQGTTLRIRHAERLKDNGQTDLSNIDYHYRPTDASDPFQTDIFTLRGGEDETFRARFNYKGFQYVEVSCDEKIQLDINGKVTRL